jgi:hypothetical protein
MASLRALLTALPLSVAACGGSVTSDPPDATVDAVIGDASTLPDAEVPTPPDAGIDAEGSRPRCDVSQPFGTPVKLPGPVNGDTTEDQSPWLSRDERRMYFSSNRDPRGTLLHLAVRDDADATFGQPQLVDVPGTSFFNVNPTLSDDERTLWIESRGDLFATTREAIGDPFPAATRMAITSSETGVLDAQPFVTLAGNALYFSSTRSPVTSGYGLFRATRSGADFAIAANAQPIITGAQHVFLSDDERTIYYMVSNNGTKIVTATRTLVTDPFGAATELTALGTAERDDENAPGWVSPDGCRLYMHSNRGTVSQRDIYVATRPPLP